MLGVPSPNPTFVLIHNGDSKMWVLVRDNSCSWSTFSRVSVSLLSGAMAASLRIDLDVPTYPAPTQQILRTCETLVIDSGSLSSVTVVLLPLDSSSSSSVPPFRLSSGV